MKKLYLLSVLCGLTTSNVFCMDNDQSNSNNGRPIPVNAPALKPKIKTPNLWDLMKEWEKLHEPKNITPPAASSNSNHNSNSHQQFKHDVLDDSDDDDDIVSLRWTIAEKQTAITNAIQNNELYTARVNLVTWIKSCKTLLDSGIPAHKTKVSDSITHIDTAYHDILKAAGRNGQGAKIQHLLQPSHALLGELTVRCGIKDK